MVITQASANPTIAIAAFPPQRRSVALHPSAQIAKLRRWWLDYRTREGLRAAQDHVLCETGFRRAADAQSVASGHRHP